MAHYRPAQPDVIGKAAVVIIAYLLEFRLACPDTRPSAAFVIDIDLLVDDR